MKQTKKWISILCITGLLLSAMVGCSGGAGSSSGASSETQQPQVSAAPSEAGSAGGKVDLRFSWWGSDARHEATLQAIDLFESNNPGVTISGEYMGSDGYKDKLMTQLAGGTAPDIIQIDNPWLADMQKQFNSFADLDALGLDHSDFDKGFVDDFGYVDGVLYALPTGTNGFITLLNTAVLKEAGVNLGDSWSWDKLIEEGQKVNRNDPNKYFMNMDQSELAIIVFKPLIKQITGEQLVRDDYTLGFTRDDLVRALSIIKEMFDKGVAEPATEAFLYKTKYYENPKWINNEIGMSFTGASTLKARKEGFADTAAVMSYPMLEDAKESGILVRPAQMMTINSNSVSTEMSAKFLNFFFNDPDAALILKDHRSVPPTSMAQKKLLENNLIDPMVVEAVGLILANPGNPENAASGNLQLETIMVDTVEQAVMSGKSLEKVADDMISQFEVVVEELKALLES